MMEINTIYSILACSARTMEIVTMLVALAIPYDGDRYSTCNTAQWRSMQCCRLVSICFAIGNWVEIRFIRLDAGEAEHRYYYCYRDTLSDR